MGNYSIVVLDFETTGLSPDYGDRVIEVGAVLIQDNEIVDRFQSLMNPGKRISSFIENYTGITNEMLKSAPPVAEVMERFASFISQHHLVAHNASFDRRFLDSELRRINLQRSQEFACSMLVSRRLYPEAPSHSLESLVNYKKLKTTGVYHRALADAEMTGHLWIGMINDLKSSFQIDAVPFSVMQSLSKISKAATAGFLKRVAEEQLSQAISSAPRTSASRPRRNEAPAAETGQQPTARKESKAMKVIAINGSPRKKWNTATLLEKALAGAKSSGAEVEIVHLYDLNFKGCQSCFACKLKNGASYGTCAMNDDLTPLLEKIAAADAFVLGSPIYFGTVTGEMRSFMERLFFPYLAYTRPPTTLFKKKIRAAFIYTMNVSEEMMAQNNYPVHINLNEAVLARTFGAAETLCSFETLQFEDYDKVVFSYCDPHERKKRHETVFPDDCRKAFELGERLVQPLP
ncbi:exonuclease domain-containing protein [Geomonas sp.]|uniref:exonuclease domain-containing protein n=1 Tax=Geomonas sp. TaxID=2651584 RepID=UPI002B4783AE|nr:exonuclease domain-containing protein [Geomonas sp.]HJV34253.1 exonuclease domain-containing protein [Geomonas sp.]